MWKKCPRCNEMFETQYEAKKYCCRQHAVLGAVTRYAQKKARGRKGWRRGLYNAPIPAPVLPIDECPVCHQPFQKKKASEKYCSQKCQYAARLERERPANKARSAAKRMVRPDPRTDKKIASERRWRQENPDKRIASKERRRAVLAAVNNTLSVAEWQDIETSYGDKCVYCGKPGSTMDHLVPLYSGGGHTADNVVPACRSCNSKKGTRPLLVFLYRQLQCP